jgi:hypothetical protein
MTSRNAVLILALCLAPAAARGQTADPAGAIHGVVVDTRGGAGVRDVSVRLKSTAQTVTTDADGRFVFDGAPAGGQELDVSAVDFLLVKKTVIVPANGVSMAPRPSLRATIRRWRRSRRLAAHSCKSCAGS